MEMSNSQNELIHKSAVEMMLKNQEEQFQMQLKQQFERFERMLNQAHPQNSPRDSILSYSSSPHTSNS